MGGNMSGVESLDPVPQQTNHVVRGNDARKALFFVYDR
jgi:hypothetical protein